MPLLPCAEARARAPRGSVARRAPCELPPVTETAHSRRGQLQRTKSRLPALWIAAALLVAGAGLPPEAVAGAPAWWTQRGVIDPTQTANDYAPINQGQLKLLAVSAFAEFEARLANIPGGIGAIDSPSSTGSRLTALITAFAAAVYSPSAATNDYAPVNLGQLKAAAQPFYDRLIELRVVSAYPWATATAPANDYAPANIGQAKNLFSFDLAKSTAGDGIPDVWKLAYGLSLTTPNLASQTAPSGTVTNLQAYQLGLNPNSVDSDGDGMLDTVKLANGLSLTAPDNPAVGLVVSGFTAP